MATVNSGVQQTPQKSTSKREELSPRDALYATVKSYRDLEVGFDGDGGNPPEQNDVNNMLSFIDHIPDSAIDSVEPQAIDGESGFEWDEPGKHHLEVIFVDGEMSFFGRMDGREILGDVDYDENAIPEKLRQFLSDMFPG